MRKGWPPAADRRLRLPIPHNFFAELHEATSLPWPAWRFRIRSGAACGVTSPDCATCWTARSHRALAASGRSPITFVKRSISHDGRGRWQRASWARTRQSIILVILLLGASVLVLLTVEVIPAGRDGVSRVAVRRMPRGRHQRRYPRRLREAAADSSCRLGLSALGRRPGRDG